ncbi:hypothetical protein EB74_07995 [Mycobacterium sp. SWH-M5]|nr:hypothetical protein EB74_07995 [Mycobacterium sp. SWH-M5]
MLLSQRVEDFGIVPVESMATGTPVIALGEGGAVDTAISEVTGVHISLGPDDEDVVYFATALATSESVDDDR